MPYPNPSLCRISLHADTVQADLALPAGVPIGALIPSVVDMLASRGGARPTARAAAPYRLSRPGTTALDNTRTLAQHGIRNGAVLLLTRTAAELPTPRFDDLAEQVSATVNSRTRPWTPRATRLAAGLAAVWLAGVGGFVAVPGGPGAPNALLAAAAAAAVAVLAMQVADGGATMTAVCCLAVPAAVAALAAVLTPVSPQVISALTVVASIGLLQAAARVSVRAAGLVQRAQKAPPPTAGVDDQTTRAHDLLSGMVAGLSAAAVLGVVGAAIGVNTSGAPRFGGAALAAVSGAALLLRARWHTDRAQIAALVSGGIASLTVALVAAAATTPQHVAWLCATAVALAGTALYLGSATPVVSPVTHRGIELFEYLVLAAVVPAACWVCGCYGAARGLNLT